MSPRLREFYKREFLAEMRAGYIDGHHTRLPSECAKIVGERWSVSPEMVLLAFAPEETV